MAAWRGRRTILAHHSNSQLCFQEPTKMDSLKATAAQTAASLRSVNWKEGILTAPLILTYIVTGILSIIVPVSQWSANKNSYYSAAGYYIEYENQQREYEEAQNGNNNNNNGYYSYEDCAWWNVACRKQQYQYASYNQDNNNNNYQQEIPQWYIMLGGQTEEMRRWEEENTGRRGGDTEATAGLKFVYVWMVLLFVGILIFGTVTLYKKTRRAPLIATLLFFANFCLLTLIMAGQGLISSEGRMFDESVYGWYGQMGVLIAYQAFWFLLFTVAFASVLGIFGCMEKGRQYDDKEDEVEMSSSSGAGYSNMGADGETSAPANESGYSAPSSAMA